MKNDGSLIRLNCPLCSKTNLLQIINCPKRSQNCSYLTKKIKYVSQGSTGLTIFFAIFGLFFTGASILFAISGLKASFITQIIFILFSVPFLIFGLIFFLLGLFLIFGTQVIVYSANNSSSCLIYKLFGFTIANKYYSHREKISLLSGQINSEFPASIAIVKDSAKTPGTYYTLKGIYKILKGQELVNETIKESWLNFNTGNNAREVLVSIFISLIANKAIEIYKVKTETYLFTWKIKKISGKYEYLVYPAENCNKVKDGILETTILNNIVNWHEKQTFWLSECPIAPNIQTLIKSIYEKNEDFPEQWLCDYIREDGYIKGIFSKTEPGIYKIKTSNLNSQKASKETIEQLKEKFRNNNPVFYSVLKNEVEEGITAMDKSSD